jgi:hypothetical protein
VSPARGRWAAATALALLAAGISLSQLGRPPQLGLRVVDESLAVLGTRPTAVLAAFAAIAAGAAILAMLAAGRLPALELPDRPPPLALEARPRGVALVATAAAVLGSLCVLASQGTAVPWYPLLLLLALGLAAAGLRLCDSTPAAPSRPRVFGRRDLAAAAVLGAMVAASAGFRIDHWYFSWIGDEGSFFHRARDLLHGPAGNIFDLSYVHAKNPLVDSLYQSLFLRLLGENVIAWRLAEVAVAAAAAILAYLVVVRLTAVTARGPGSRLPAFVGGLVLGCSAYTMAFCHIGYTNLHTMVPPLLILLSMAGIAARPTAVRLFGLGCLLGLCAFTFLATLVIWPVAALFWGRGVLAEALRGRVGAAAVVGFGFLCMTLPILAADPSPLFENLQASHALGFGADRGWLLGFAASLGAFWHNSRWFSHHVAGSLLDPVAGGLTAMGLAAAVALRRRSPGDRFLLLWFVLGCLVIALTHPFEWPILTRLLFVLPAAALLAARGAAVATIVLEDRLGLSPRAATSLLATAAALIVIVNLHQLYVVVPSRLPAPAPTCTVRTLQEHPHAPVLEVAYDMDPNRALMLEAYPGLAARHGWTTPQRLASLVESLDPATVLLVFYSPRLADTVEKTLSAGWTRRCCHDEEGRCLVWVFEPAAGRFSGRP